MRSSMKKLLIEMVEYIEFPMAVYIYETGRVIAGNRLAKDVIGGTSCQNVNLLWPNQKKLKFEAATLKGESQLFFDKEIVIGEESIFVDFEVNVLPIAGEHIVVVFMERSYKQAFRMDQAKLLPGLIWRNAQREYVTLNTTARISLNRMMYLQEHQEEETEQERLKFCELEALENEIFSLRQPEFGKVEQVDFASENNGFANINKLPVVGKKEEFMGVLVIYKPVIVEQEFHELYENARFENALLRECVMADQKIVLGISYDDGMQVRYATPNISNLGISLADISKREVCWMDCVAPDDRLRVRGEIEEAWERRDRFFKQKYRVLDAEGQEVWVNAVVTGKELQCNLNLMHIVLQMSEEKGNSVNQTKVVMKHETFMDYLTGLPNRMKYELDAEKLMEAAIASKKKGYVIVLDLDDFRHINEGLGPEYGDILLKKISKVLNDIPQIENYCYRVDGDEFLVFVRTEYAKQIEEIIQQCLQVFQNSWQLDDKECFCSVSIGIAEYPKDSAMPRELLKHADAAVYEAKRKGKNRIQHYKKAVLKNSQDRVVYEKYLRKAIAKGCVEFEMFFQPIVATQSKKLVSSEALLRWYSPELGFITPINFISLSEYLGLIVPLGEYVLKETFEKCKYWNDTYDPDFMISVNLSVVQLVQPNIVDRIMEIARNTKVNVNNIILEVTESLAVEDMHLMKSVLVRLKEHGFNIALDDFGTGYSSLNHIMEMPLDYVKIDRSFVSKYGTPEFNPSLLSAITELAHSVNMEVIVEGVETKQQMEFLMFLDADRIQGYLYGKPMAAQEFEKRFFQE